ncbi:type VI secretion system Vgr family protein [Sorangium atrum]|uniref:Type VI secretion system tip protein TssI/VgrG n=1 Tax=Sorangium atrum TaxID=2995308 RepID=A0ABT5BXK9_9BACT|nr:type VI secretion system tip protein TssI/VgrG [Sorangium aterium]MDC0678905.1 type VI secretion system tip protein TssI/VgrG [Sorangium aterium]
MPDNFVVQSSALPSSTKLVAFHGTEGISKPYRFELYLVMTNDAGQSFDMAAAVGQPVSISLERSDGGEPFLRSGVLGSIELINEFVGRSVFRATMVPRLALLAMSFHSRVFTVQAIPAIIQAVLQKGGVTDCALQLQGSYNPEEHICQYRETDYAFIARWMEREGIYYYFEHGEGGETLVLVDNKSAHQPHGGKPIRYFPQPGGANTAKDTFHAFTCRHEAMPGTVRLKDYNYATPAVPVTGQASVSPSGVGEVSVFGARFFSSGDGARLARIKAESLSATGVVYQAMGKAATVVPGFTFEIEDHPRAAFNTKYLAIEVEHWSNQAPDMPELRDFTTWTENYRMEAKAIPTTTQFRAPQVTEWPRIYGTEIAIVEGAAVSEYAQIDSQGRYRIKFLFDESDLSGGKASTWVRMLQPHGGGIEGFHFPLRAGVEVMCAFEGGDPDRPAIVGVAPNALTPSPVTSGNNTRNVIQTGGRNRLELEDQAGQERVTLSTPYDNTYLRMGAPNGGASYEVKSQGHAYVWIGGSSENIVTGNRTAITVGISESVIGGFSLSAVGGYAGSFIAGYSQNVILGYRHTTILGNEKTILRGNRKTNITRNRSTKIGGDDTFTLVGDRLATIRGNSSLRIMGRRNTQIRGKDESTFFNGRETTVFVSNKTTINGTSETDVNGTRRTDVRGHATGNFYAGRTTTVHAGGSTKTIRGGNTAKIYGPRKTTVYGPSSSTINGPAESKITGLYTTKIGSRVEVINGTKYENIKGLAFKRAPLEIKKLNAAEISAKGYKASAEILTIKARLGLSNADLHILK